MKKFFIKLIGITCLSICCHLIAKSQSAPQPKIETPNVASLEKFGDVPVDLSTGVPNISIPIHTLQYGSISVPVSLRYHPGSVKVAQHEGWVGLGWDLECGGVITRKVNWQPDEYGDGSVPSSGGTTSNTYYPLSWSSVSGSTLVNNNGSWNSTTSMTNYFTPGQTGVFPIDVCADEFSFNFLGYSGKFYCMGANVWKVVCDQNVQVQLTNPSNPFLSTSGVKKTIQDEYSTSGHLNTNWLNDNIDEVFSGFTLTVPDGTKYYFGGMKGADGIGMEFSGPYQPNPVGVGTSFDLNTWLLTKIVDVDNNEVDYNYSADYPTADLGFYYDGVTGSCSSSYGKGLFQDANSFSSSQPGVLNVNQLSGHLNLPLYLDNITCNNETITFSHSPTNPLNSLRFSSDDFDYFDYHDYGKTTANSFTQQILFYGTTNGTGVLLEPSNYLQWEQLNKITITTGKAPEINQWRQYSFTYSAVPATRLELKNFAELDNTGQSVEKYSFDYNTPITCSYAGNYSDSWGFFNNISVSTNYANYSDYTSGSIFANKRTDGNAVLSELLKTIYYPTGGSTKFTWQAHDFSQIVSVDRQSVIAPNWPTWAHWLAGGSRIARVQSYQPDGTLAVDKKYLYVRGYSNANPAGTGSSGILNGTPSYNMTLNSTDGGGRKLILGPPGSSISVDDVSLNSFANYSYNSQGSYIGYDEVVVIDADNSYTRNFFTSYGPDLNNVSHYDIQPTGTLGWLSGTDTYYPMNTLENERGKPTGVFKYTSNDVLIQKTILTYRNDPDRFNNYIKLINFNASYSQCSQSAALTLATANEEFNYDYYVTNESVTSYDQLGENPMTTSTSFTYNVNNLVSSKTEINSKAETVLTAYTYPNEITSTDPGYSTYQAMTNAHIISPVIQTVVTKNGVQLSLNKTNYYTPATDIYKPQNAQVQFGSNAIETRQQFYNYESQGNLEEESKTNDIHTVYLWGYNRQYPVAKITGSTLSLINASFPTLQSQIDAATATVNNDAGVRNLLKNLQAGLTNAIVTYYTYLPLTGITSVTDERGQTTYYKYDAFQRLQSITDFAGNILKTFNYQYQITQ